MNSKRLTPLEQLRLEKRQLRQSCIQQEGKLLVTLEYIEDNLIPIALSTTAQALINPSHLFSSHTAGETQETSSNGFPKGILGFVLRTALGFVTNRTRVAGKAASSLPIKIISKFLPIAAPIASFAWGFTQPYILGFVKKRVKSLFSWKKKKVKK